MLLSESLGVSSSQLWKYGVFDSYLGIDSLLHVDPARLRSTRIPELRGSYKRFHQYFEGILHLIAAAKPGDALERQAIKKLIFPEIPEAALGYAQGSNRGRGLRQRLRSVCILRRRQSSMPESMTLRSSKWQFFSRKSSDRI